MNSSYWLGVAAAVAAGIAFNLGILIQKLAVMKTKDGSSLMRQLVRSPLWLAGFALQFVIGMPLNMLAQAKIGPAIIPGLMAIGLIVLAVGAVRLASERLRVLDIAGISFVITAVALFGLSRLEVDMPSINLYEPEFLVRLGSFTMAAAALSLLCHRTQKSSVRLRGILRTLNAGLLLSQSNLWLGVLTALLAKWSTGIFSVVDFIYIIIASGIVFAGSMLGIAETQRALQYGEASRMIPIQYVPSQILPVIAYFAVFSLSPVSPAGLPLAVAGIVLVLSGAALLARRMVQQGGLPNER